MNKIAAVFALLWLSSGLLSQSKAPAVKYWVNLNDKNETPYSISDPAKFLSAKSIQRRAYYGTKLDASDLPVVPGYISNIDTVKNVTILYASKWLNGVVIAIDSASVAQAALDKINTFSFVKNTTRVKRYIIHNKTKESINESSGRPASSDALSKYAYGGSGGQIRQLNLDCLHEKGFRGQGMTIAVCDAGFFNVDVSPVFDSLRNSGRIKGTRDFVDSDNNVYDGGEHGTYVLSCMAAIRNNDVMGTAPLADYWLFKTEEGPTETISEEYNWIRAAEYADSIGVDIITTSLGYTTFDIPSQNHTYQTLNGRTAPMSIAGTMAVRKGIFVLTSAGNEGANSWHYVVVPGDADSVCTVGAVDSAGVYAEFSSVGPTADGRIKPDLVACGARTWVCGGNGVCFPGNGTSFSTPVLAGAVACFWQANRNMNNMDVLDSLRRSGSHASVPNNTVGWGVPFMPCVSSDAQPCSLVAGFTYTADENGSVTFSSTSTGASGKAIYKWIFGDGIAGSGITATHTYKNSDTAWHSAYLEIDNRVFPPCKAFSEKQKIKFPKDFDFTVYTDENNNRVKVRLAKTSYTSVKVEVFDMFGKLILSGEPASTDDVVLDLASAHLPEAYYVIRVSTSNGTLSKKIFKP